jgi:hypothetical protein
MSFEPHFTHTRRTSIENKSFDDPYATATSLLAELDKIAPIKAFDAFPKVQPTYTTSSRRGGILTAVLGATMFLLVLNDLGEYFYGQPSYEFHVDQEIDRKDLQLNVDITVAMPCHCEFLSDLRKSASWKSLCPIDLSIDLRDVVGDRLHLSDEFAKDGVSPTFLHRSTIFIILEDHIRYRTHDIFSVSPVPQVNRTLLKLSLTEPTPQPLHQSNR